MISSVEISWLAGLLEGEGAFGGRRGDAKLQIRLRMTDRDVVERAASLMGARRISQRPGSRPGYKDVYEATVSGRDAAAMMMSLYVLMGARRRSVFVELLSRWRRTAVYWRYRTRCPHGHALPTQIPAGRRQRECKTCRRDAARDAYRRKHGVTSDRWRKKVA